jgi:hypothetical protein
MNGAAAYAAERWPGLHVKNGTKMARPLGTLHQLPKAVPRLSATVQY